jgi:hypothetical protein
MHTGAERRRPACGTRKATNQRASKCVPSCLPPPRRTGSAEEPLKMLRYPGAYSCVAMAAGRTHGTRRRRTSLLLRTSGSAPRRLGAALSPCACCAPSMQERPAVKDLRLVESRCAACRGRRAAPCERAARSERRGARSACKHLRDAYSGVAQAASAAAARWQAAAYAEPYPCSAPHSERAQQAPRSRDGRQCAAARR